MTSIHDIERSLPDWIPRSTVFSVVITDLEGRYLYVNDCFYNRFSWITKHFIGKPFANSVHPDDVEKCNAAAWECIQHPDKIVEVQVRKPLNHEGIHESTDWEFSLFKDLHGEPVGIFCLGYDITELRYFMHEVVKKNLQLDHIAQSHSHEIRAPLTSIMALVELMQDEKSGEKNPEYLQMLQSKSQELDAVIHKVVALATKPPE